MQIRNPLLIHNDVFHNGNARKAIFIQSGIVKDWITDGTNWKLSTTAIAGDFVLSNLHGSTALYLVQIVNGVRTATTILAGGSVTYSLLAGQEADLLFVMSVVGGRISIIKSNTAFAIAVVSTVDNWT